MLLSSESFILQIPPLLTEDLSITAGGESDRARKIKECLIALMRLGLECSSPLPRERKRIDDVAVELRRIKNAYTMGPAQAPATEATPALTRQVALLPTGSDS